MQVTGVVFLALPQGYLQSLCLVLSSCRTSMKEEYSIFFYLSAAEEDGKGFVHFSLLSSVTGARIFGAQVMMIFWLMG